MATRRFTRLADGIAGPSLPLRQPRQNARPETLKATTDKGQYTGTLRVTRLVLRSANDTTGRAYCKQEKGR